MSWDDDQHGEVAWWDRCLTTYGEETKQLVYADRMGLVNTPVDGQGPVYLLGGRRVIDLGGGPVSLLLKCRELGSSVVVDPGAYPGWVRARYDCAGIEWVQAPAEGYCTGSYDEAWIYNCLQHTIDPQRIIANARAMAPVVRLFEWVGIAAHAGHPHELSVQCLNEWLGATGTLERFDGDNECYGVAYHGVFR